MRYVGVRQIVIDDRPAPTPYWAPDRAFAGQVVTLIGGGPSHAAFDLALLAGRRFVAINSGCRAVRPIATAADPLYFTDNSWSENRPELLRDWPGPVICANRHAKARLGDAVRFVDVLGLTERAGVITDHLAASSGHIAAALAAVMGARRIVLIGFECQPVGGRTHGHRDYDNQDTTHFAERFLPGWRALATALPRLGAQVVNATPHSAIPDFPFVPLAEAIA